MTGAIRLQGVAASIGVAIGPASVVGEGGRTAIQREIGATETAAELHRFDQAVCESRREIESAKQELLESHGRRYTPILDVYLLMHADPMLIEATCHLIRRETINAEWALHRVVEGLKAPLLSDASTYLRERARDIEHVKEHLLRHLQGGRRGQRIADPSVLVAHDLSPADAVHLLGPPTVALVTEAGGPSSHTAILARTFGVPAVFGVSRLSTHVKPRQTILVDGFAGEVTLAPSKAQVRAAEARKTRLVSFVRAGSTSSSTTTDGVHISVTANIGLPSEAHSAVQSGAEGVGLFRTEFTCLEREIPPPEEDQLEAYRLVVRAMAPYNVVFRTFDWRLDKLPLLADLGGLPPDWLRTQLRAILRASRDGAASVMFPMVATLDQLDDRLALVNDCREELERQGLPVGELPVGMMVEVPSAAMLAREFASRAEFFAVGTNDLVQYALGVDRRHPGSDADLHTLNPAVLRLLETTLEAAERASIGCSMCGGMASDSVALVVALGLGFRQLSVPLNVLPLVRGVVRNIDLRRAADVAKRALACSTALEVRNLVLEAFSDPLGALWREQGIA